MASVVVVPETSPRELDDDSDERRVAVDPDVGRCESRLGTARESDRRDGEEHEEGEGAFPHGAR